MGKFLPDVIENSHSFSLEDRYDNAKTVTGTRSHHSFVPVSEVELQMRRVSEDEQFSAVFVGVEGSKPVNEIDKDVYKPGTYVACMYDDDWFIGNIVECSEENQDVYIRFMRRSNLTLTWPPDSRKEECWVPYVHLICPIQVPDVLGRGARQYRLAADDLDRIQSLLPRFK